MDLHYSQTLFISKPPTLKFHYLMDLHYSQTCNFISHNRICFTTLWIYTILKHQLAFVPLIEVSLPYGFTLFSNLLMVVITRDTVSLPYGFTLFSNYERKNACKLIVSLPYGFTLFSNPGRSLAAPRIVSLPYGFTLFSNTALGRVISDQFHYLMDLHYSQTQRFVQSCTTSFTTLWIYTILKQCRHRLISCSSFTTLWIYTILKRAERRMLHHLCFTTLWIYTILKQVLQGILQGDSFTTLWIYTILKPQISCAHYTAQGKSTRSSTIVLWRNGIVKGAQIPIQHIEFGAHIYAHRCLAL